MAVELSRVSTQIGMFPEDPTDPTAGYHKGNAESRAAFEALIPHLAELEQKILQFAERCSQEDRWSTILTVKAVIFTLKLRHQTASARLADLKSKGLLEKTTVPPLRHDGCAVLRITDLGRRTLRYWESERA